MRLNELLVAGAAALFAMSSSVAAQPMSDWLPVDGLAGVTGDLPVNAAIVWDPDGPGSSPELLVLAGGFVGAGDIAVNGLAAWDGATWHDIGGGATGGRIWALEVYDGDLIIAGDFQSVGTGRGEVAARTIARWDGSEWHAMGSGAMGSVMPGVFDLTHYNGDLVATGRFTHMDGVTVNAVTRWDGTQWHPFGSGVGTTDNGLTVVSAATVFNGDLIVGGPFPTAGGVVVDDIACWNGTSWSALDDFHMAQNIGALAVYDGELIAAGSFIDLSTGSTDMIMRWTGTQWQEVGTGTSDHVFVMTVYNGELIAGGIFTSAGGVSALRIARWNGSEWASLGFGMRSVAALTVYNGELIVGGTGTRPSGNSMSQVVRWDGAAAGDFGRSFSGVLYDLETYNGELIAAGAFVAEGGEGESVVGIARREADGWGNLGLGGISGAEGYVFDLAMFDGNLLASGSFTSIGGVSALGMASWNGETWSSFGDRPVISLLVHEGDLYGAGGFGANRHVARWNRASQTWQPVGTFQPNVSITALTVFNGQLVAGGFGGIGVNTSVWRWDGTSWLPIGQHLGFSSIQTLAVYNDELLAGGYETPQVPNGIVRFNGTSWVTFEGGVYLSNDITADVLAVFDLIVHDGDLIVAGSFGQAGEQQYMPDSVTANHLARFDGAEWHAFGAGLSDASICAHVHQGEIHVGGWFDIAGERPAAHWARWGSTLDCGPADFNGDTLVDVLDFLDFIDNFSACENQPAPCGSLGDPDINGDTGIDILDFLDFIDAFSMGC